MTSFHYIDPVKGEDVTGRGGLPFWQENNDNTNSAGEPNPRMSVC